MVLMTIATLSSVHGAETRATSRKCLCPWCWNADHCSPCLYPWCWNDDHCSTCLCPLCWNADRWLCFSLSVVLKCWPLIPFASAHGAEMMITSLNCPCLWCKNADTEGRCISVCSSLLIFLCPIIYLKLSYDNLIIWSLLGLCVCGWFGTTFS